jgi:hypothetical protein
LKLLLKEQVKYSETLLKELAEMEKEKAARNARWELLKLMRRNAVSTSIAAEQHN